MDHRSGFLHAVLGLSLGLALQSVAIAAGDGSRENFANRVEAGFVFDQ